MKIELMKIWHFIQKSYLALAIKDDATNGFLNPQYCRFLMWIVHSIPQFCNHMIYINYASLWIRFLDCLFLNIWSKRNVNKCSYIKKSALSFRNTHLSPILSSKPKSIKKKLKRTLITILI